MAVGWGAMSLLLGFAVTERKAQRSTDPSQRPGLRELLRSSEARQAGLVMAAAGAGFGTVFTFHQPYALSLGITRVSGFFIGYALFALVVRLGLMGYVERFGRMRVSALCVLLYAAGVIATAGLRPGMLEVVGAMLGTAQGIFYPVFNAVAVESVPAYQRGSMMALYHGGFNAGTALAMLLGGAFAERFGYPALFVTMGSITALAAAWLMRGKLYVQPAT
jgi:MFS family permease